MADISKITTLDGTTYDLKDTIARSVIPFGVTDSTSTNVAFTATVPNVTELRSGTTIILMNNKVTSAANCTLNVNGLGAKPIYRTDAAESPVTTHFSVNRTWMFIYNETRVSGGCWDLVYLFDSNTTYSNFSNLSLGNAGYLADSIVYRYQLLFQIDDEYVTPLNNVNNGYNNTNKAMLTDVEFDPFGDIFYYASTGTVNADARVNGVYMCYAYGVFDLRYTFNCGQTLTADAPVYLKVSLQSNGKVKIVDSAPWEQTLPSTADGYYYIYLGRTCSTYQMTLEREHPVFYHDGTTIRRKLPPADVEIVNGHTVNADVPADAKFTDTTYTANTSKLVTTTVPNITSTGSVPTLGTEIPADDITEWTTNVPTNFEVTGEKLKITVGSAATLKYTAKSIPNVTSAGSAPTLGTAITVATGSLASNGSGGTVATGITAS